MTVASPSLTPASEADPRLAADARELHRVLSDLMRVVQFRDRDRICCHDVSVSQCYALEAILRRGPLTLNELAAHLYLDKSTASRVVKALAEKGYIERRPHPDDGRAMQLVATAAGRRLHTLIERDLLAEVEALVADFDPEVRRALASLLARLSRAAVASARETCACRVA
ncbi:MAG TPA: MarR family transcriptional regulator [Thermoanaerobaculia bacterium]|nr:MarR family transcriptional regulator [Thermoanaerobaculia bacterium]